MSDNYVKTKHDIGVTNTNGDVVGLILAQKSDGTPAYAVFDRKHLADQFFTGTPAQTYQDPEVEIPLAQYSWRAGMGLKTYDPSDSERYYKSKNMDLRNRGEAIGAYKDSSLNWPATTNIWQLPVNYQDPSSAWTNPLNSMNGLTTDSAVASIDASVWSGALEYRLSGYADQINYYCSTDAPNDVYQVSVNAHNGASWFNVYQGNFTRDAWETKPFTPTAVNAISLKLKNVFAGSRDGAINAVKIDCHATNSGVHKFSNYNGIRYATHGNMLCNIAANGTLLDEVRRFSNDITALEPFTDAKMYLALNMAHPYYQVNTVNSAIAFTETNLGNSKMKFMKTLHKASPTMYGSTSNYEIRSTIDPSENGSAWSTVTNVGSSLHDITKLVQGGGTLYPMKEDKPYYLDSSGNVQDDLASEFENLERSDAGKASYFWDGKVYLVSGSHLREIDGSVKTWLHPSLSSSDLPEYTRDIQAVTGDEQWLFSVVGGNGINVELLASRYESVGGSTDWRWHPQRTVIMTNCDEIWTTAIGQKRIYMGSTNSDQPLAYIPLPDNYGDVKDDANRDFDSGSYFHTPRLHGDFRLTLKAYTKLELELGHDFDTDIYFEAHYNTLNNSTWTAVGDFKGNSDTRIATGYLPLNPVDTMLQLNFVTNTDDSQKTPSLIGYNLTAILYPPRKDIIACTVRVAQGVQTKDVLSSKYESIKLALDNGRDATWPVKIFDIHGDPINVKFLPLPSGTPWTELYKDEKTRTTELRYNLLLQEIDIG